MLLSVRRSLAALLFLLVCLVSRADYIVQFSPVDSLTRLDLRKCETLVFLPGDDKRNIYTYAQRTKTTGDKDNDTAKSKAR